MLNLKNFTPYVNFYVDMYQIGYFNPGLYQTIPYHSSPLSMLNYTLPYHTIHYSTNHASILLQML